MNTITVPVLTYNVATSNNRFYPKAVVESAVAVAYGKKFLCKYDLPTGVTDEDFGHHAMIGSSHVVEQIYTAGSDLWAEIRFLPTASGMQLQQQWDAAQAAGATIKFRAAGIEELEQRADRLLEVRTFKFTGVHVDPNAF